MRQTRLILLDGVPGSGKSTLAQTLLRHLHSHGIPARWWYEEDAAHPVYVFHDPASLQEIRTALSTGRYSTVVTQALVQWQRFAEDVQSAEEVVLLDGCLFGYLTWSLFPLAVPDAEIYAYLATVEHILAPLAPCLIYLYQDDIAASFRRVFASRGPTTEHAYVCTVEESRYGQVHALRGFEGLVHYWAAYRRLTDKAFAGLPWAKILLETTAGDWATYEQCILDLLDLPPSAPANTGWPQELNGVVGTYQSIDSGTLVTCMVRLENHALLLEGMPEVWPGTRLVPTAPGVFDVASLPIEISFTHDAAGDGATMMTVRAPTLLGGRLPTVFKRELSTAQPLS